MITKLRGIIADGSLEDPGIAGLVPQELPIELPRGEDHEIQLEIVTADGQPYDIAGCTIRLAVRRWLSDASAMFTREAVLGAPTTAGLATITSPSLDSLGLKENKTYWYDVQLTDITAKRWQVVLKSGYHIRPIVSQVDEPILPPLVDAGAPIAIGPPGPRGLSVLSGARAPLPGDGQDGEFWIDTTVPTAQVIYGPKLIGDWGVGVPFGGGGTAVSTDDPLPSAVTADPGLGPEPSAWDHVHPYTIAVAGSADGWMSGTMAQQLADLVAADFGAQIATVSGDLAALSTTVSGHTSTLATHTSAIANLVSDLADAVADIGTLTGDLSALATVVSGHTSTLASHTSSIASNASAISALQALDMIAGAGLTGGGTLTANRTFNVGATDSSITVAADGIALSSTLQTAISTNASDIASLTTTVSGHTTSIGTLTSDVATLNARQIIAGTGLTGGGTLAADRTLTLADTAVAPGSYTNGSFTVDAQGRLTAASSGATPALASVTLTAGAGLTGGGDLSTNRTFDIGQNADNSITVNANDIQLSSTLQTAISTNTSNISSLTTTVSGHTTSITNLGAVKYIVQVADAAVPSAQALGALATGIVKNTITTGVLSIAAAADIPSLLTTKGDLLGYSTLPLRVAVAATDGWVLTVDAASAAGWKWAVAAPGNGYGAIENNGSAVTQRTTINLSTEFTATDTASKTALALTTAGVGFAKLADLTGLSVLGRSANGAAGVMAAITAVTDGHVLRLAGTTLGFGTLAAGAFAASTIAGTVLTGFSDTTLPVANSSGQLTSSSVTLASNYLDHAASSSGATVKRSVRNTSNTATSKALDLIEVAGATADDPFTQYSVSGVTNFVVGLDNSNSDYFTMNVGTALSSSAQGVRIGPTSGTVNFGTGSSLQDGTTIPMTCTVASANLCLDFYFNSAAGGSQIMRRQNDNSGVIDIGLTGSTTAYTNVAGQTLAGSFIIRGNRPYVIATTTSSAITFGTNDTQRLQLTGAGIIRASLGQTVASASGAIWDGVDVAAATLTWSGNTNVTTATGVNLFDIKQPTITSASAVTVSLAATVRIAGAPTATGSTTLTKAYSLWIDAGLPRIDSSTANGSVATVLGSVGPVGSNTTVQEWLTVDLGGTTRYLPCF